MRSRGTPRFWAAYRELPPEIQHLARKAYRLFRENPRHPSLQFKRVHDGDPIYAVRVTLGYRALGLLEDGEIVWFWIGSHAEYDRLLNSAVDSVGPTATNEPRGVTSRAAPAPFVC